MDNTALVDESIKRVICFLTNETKGTKYEKFSLLDIHQKDNYIYMYAAFVDEILMLRVSEVNDPVEYDNNIDMYCKIEIHFNDKDFIQISRYDYSIRHFWFELLYKG